MRDWPFQTPCNWSCGSLEWQARGKYVYITLFVFVWIVLTKHPFSFAVAWSQNVAVVRLIDFVERVAHDNYGINLGKGVQEMVRAS